MAELRSGPAAGAPVAPRAWLPALLLAAAAWGSSFLFISLALREFSPGQVGFGRLLVGAAVLWVMVALQRGKPHLTLKQVGAIGVAAVAMSGVPFILIPAAQQHITSILASLLNATTPLWTALFVALLIPRERATRMQWAGLLVGGVGIAVLLGAWNVSGFPVWGAALMLIASAFYGIGGTLSRILLSRIHESATTLSAVQIGLSALMLAPFALAGPTPSADAVGWGAGAMWALVALGVMGTSFAYVMFWRVVKIAGATTAASVTYLVPVVATVLGIVVLGEKVLWHEPVGAVVVLAGVWFAGRRPPAPGGATEVKNATAGRAGA